VSFARVASRRAAVDAAADDAADERGRREFVDDDLDDE